MWESSHFFYCLCCQFSSENLLPKSHSFVNHLVIFTTYLKIEDDSYWHNKCMNGRFRSYAAFSPQIKVLFQVKSSLTVWSFVSVGWSTTFGLTVTVYWTDFWNLYIKRPQKINTKDLSRQFLDLYDIVGFGWRSSTNIRWIVIKIICPTICPPLSTAVTGVE